MNAVLKPRTDMHPDEWKTRVQLAACYRIFDMLGWTEMIYNHITIRLPESVSGGEKQFLINPFGLHYSEVTASNLLKIDLKGNKLDDKIYYHHTGAIGGIKSIALGKLLKEHPERAIEFAVLQLERLAVIGVHVDDPMVQRCLQIGHASEEMRLV